MKTHRIIYQVWYDTRPDQNTSEVKIFYFLKQAQNFVKKNESKIRSCQIEALRQYYYNDLEKWQTVERKVYAWVNVIQLAGMNMTGKVR